jgi:peptidyl-prolyl cis-trans isomerase C
VPPTLRSKAPSRARAAAAGARAAITRGAAIGLVALVAILAAGPAGADDVNRVVLRVNDRIATLYDFEQRKADMQAQLLHQQDMPLEQRRDVLNHLGTTVFRDMFEEMLLMSRADQADVKISAADIASSISRMRENYKLDTDEQFQAALAQSGMNLDQLSDQVRRNLTMQTVISREVQAKIEIDEEVLRRYYRDHPQEFQVPEQVRLQELVVLDDSKLSEDERVQLAAALRKELIAGRPLADLAAENAKTGATSGLIDIGWVAKGDLSADLEKAVWDLKPGEVSEPVASRGGLHLVTLLERRAATLRPFTEVADEIRGKERERLFADKYKEYLDRLEREAYVQLDPPPEAKDFRAADVGSGELAPSLEKATAGAEKAAEAKKDDASAAPAAADAGVPDAASPAPSSPATPPPSPTTPPSPPPSTP